MEQVFATEQVCRHVDASGYVQFRYWRLYGTEGVAGKEAQIVSYQDTLTITHQDESLTQYQVHYADDGEAIEQVRLIHEFPDRFPSAQMHLWELSRFPWYKALPLPHRRPRRQPAPTPIEQLVLFAPGQASRQRRRRQG